MIDNKFEISLPIWVVWDESIGDVRGFPFGVYVLKSDDSTELPVFTDRDLAATFVERLGLHGHSTGKISGWDKLILVAGLLLLSGGDHVRVDPAPAYERGRWTAPIEWLLGKLRPGTGTEDR